MRLFPNNTLHLLLGSIRWYEWLMSFVFLPLSLWLVYLVLSDLQEFASDFLLRYMLLFFTLYTCIPGLALLLRRDAIWRRAAMTLPVEADRVRTTAWWIAVVILPLVNIAAFGVSFVGILAVTGRSEFPLDWIVLLISAVLWAGSLAFLDTLRFSRALTGFVTVASVLLWCMFSPLSPYGLTASAQIYVVAIGTLTILSYFRRHRLIAGPTESSRLRNSRISQTTFRNLSNLYTAPYVTFLLLLFAVAIGWGYAHNELDDSKVIYSSSAFGGLLSALLTLALRPTLPVYRSLPLCPRQLCIKLVTPYAILAVGYPVIALAMRSAVFNVSAIDYVTAICFGFGLAVFGAAIGFASKRTYAGTAFWFAFVAISPVILFVTLETRLDLNFAVGFALAVSSLIALHQVLSRSDSVFRRSILRHLDFDLGSNS